MVIFERWCSIYSKEVLWDFQAPSEGRIVSSVLSEPTSRSACAQASQNHFYRVGEMLPSISCRNSSNTVKSSTVKPLGEHYSTMQYFCNSTRLFRHNRFLHCLEKTSGNCLSKDHFIVQFTISLFCNTEVLGERGRIRENNPTAPWKKLKGCNSSDVSLLFNAMKKPSMPKLHQIKSE